MMELDSLRLYKIGEGKGDYCTSDEIRNDSELRTRFLDYYEDRPAELAADAELNRLFNEEVASEGAALQNNAQRFASTAPTQKSAQEIVFTDEEVDVFVAVTKKDGTIEVVTVSPEDRKDASGNTEEEKAVAVAKQQVQAEATTVASTEAATPQAQPAAEPIQNNSVVNSDIVAVVANVFSAPIVSSGSTVFNAVEKSPEHRSLEAFKHSVTVTLPGLSLPVSPSSFVAKKSRSFEQDAVMGSSLLPASVDGEKKSFEPIRTASLLPSSVTEIGFVFESSQRNSNSGVQTKASEASEKNSSNPFASKTGVSENIVDSTPQWFFAGSSSQPAYVTQPAQVMVAGKSRAEQAEQRVLASAKQSRSSDQRGSDKRHQGNPQDQQSNEEEPAELA